MRILLVTYNGPRGLNSSKERTCDSDALRHKQTKKEKKKKTNVVFLLPSKVGKCPLMLRESYLSMGYSSNGTEVEKREGCYVLGPLNPE